MRASIDAQSAELIDASPQDVSPQDDSGEAPYEYSGPWRTIWRRLRKNRAAMICFWVLIVLYLGAIFAPVIAPYDYKTQFRAENWHTPHVARMHLWDEQGDWHGPFIYGSTRVDEFTAEYTEDHSKVIPVDLFVRGDAYTFMGIDSTLHLFGTADGSPIFLLGSDSYGRDIFTRILYGSRISLSVGLLGIAISMTLGLLIGGIAGYFGGWTDFLLMRLVELILALPGLYLILTIRQAFGKNVSSTQAYMLIVCVLAFIGWAANARVIRGMVLSIKENEYVTAAEALGVGRMGIIRRHILPNTLSFVIVTATLAIPYYILGEVALSFLGVGIQEPDASWGNMLRDAQNVRYLTDYPWVVMPGFFIFLAVMAYNFLGDGLRDAADPRALE
ncbi:MAG: peptide/nickel transport system permease protein [Bradymonadia bacterium]|jgi:peptide/nickel transport system permease protein